MEKEQFNNGRKNLHVQKNLFEWASKDEPADKTTAKSTNAADEVEIKVRWPRIAKTNKKVRWLKIAKIKTCTWKPKAAKTNLK